MADIATGKCVQEKPRESTEGTAESWQLDDKRLIRKKVQNTTPTGGREEETGMCAHTSCLVLRALGFMSLPLQNLDVSHQLTSVAGQDLAPVHGMNRHFPHVLSN